MFCYTDELDSQDDSGMNERKLKRRRFLQATGLGAMSVLLNPTAGRVDGATAADSPARSEAIQGLGDINHVRLRNDMVLVRIEMGSTGKELDLSCRVQVKKATIFRLVDFYFEEGEDELQPDRYTWKCRVTRRYYDSMPMNQPDVDVITLWLENASRETEIEIETNGIPFIFTLDDLLREEEIRSEIDGAYISVNFLLDREIGEIDPADVGIMAVEENFDFVMFADTHAGLNNDKVNSYFAKNVALVNALESRPKFVIDIGDATTGQGEKGDFDALLTILDKLEVPILLGMGNHESRYRSEFGPGYNHEAFQNFFDAQKKLNGTDKLLYSFNIGGWHFVVWPDPLRGYFWARHPHYFDWLADDLDRYRERPTIFFQHVSSLPIGINPMTNYVNNRYVLKKLLGILTSHGNVKYVFSGHTHNTLKACFKTAWSYKGIKFYNLPATSNPSRSFGEPDFDGGSRGFTMVSVRGDKLTLKYRMTDGDSFEIPGTLPEFHNEEWPLWLTEEWQLPVHNDLVNGDFENGLEGWARRYVYCEDENPSSICRTTTAIGQTGSKALYLYCRKRGYEVPGDNRMPQTVNQICQAVRVQKGKSPLLRLRYLLEGVNYTPGDDSGACVMIEGYQGSCKRSLLVYWIGRAFFKPRGLWSSVRDYKHFDITSSPDEWHNVSIDVKRDFERTTTGARWEDLNLDKLLITLGVWNVNQTLPGENEHKKIRIGIYFDDINVLHEAGKSDGESTVDGTAIELKNESEIESRWLIARMGDSGR